MDGVRVDYEHGWVCVRRSNTEPLLRILYECERGLEDKVGGEWI